MKIKKAWLVAAIALVVLLAAVAMVMSSGQR